MEIPFVKESDPLHWASMNARLIPKLEEMWRMGDLKHGNTLYELTGVYRDQAIIEFLKGSLPGFYENLKKAVSAYECLIEEFEKKPGEIRKGFLSHVFYLPLICAIILDDEDRLKSFCDKYLYVLNLGKEEFFTAFVFSIYSLAIGDMNKAMDYGVKASSEVIDEFKALINLLLCVAANNQTEIELSWKAAIIEFNRNIKCEYQSMPEAVLFVDGLALLKLNQIRNGIRFIPSPPDPRLPLSIL